MGEVVATTVTPEGAVAGFMEAWRRGDFVAAAQWCQAHWYVREPDPAGLIRKWYGWRRVQRWRYLRTSEVESPWPLREVTVIVTFVDGATRKLPFICGHDQLDGQPAPLEAPGSWGPNPISGLRGIA